MMSRLLYALVMLSLALYVTGLRIPVPSLRLPIPCVRDLDCGEAGRCLLGGYGLCSSAEKTPAADGRTALSKDLNHADLIELDDMLDSADANLTIVNNSTDFPAAAGTAGTTTDSGDGASERRLVNLSLPPYAPCLRDYHCSSGRCRKLGVGVCVPDRRCANCHSSDWCDGRQCRPKKKYAEACAVPAECLSSACSDGTCACVAEEDCEAGEYCSQEGDCNPKKDVLSTCEADEECHSSTCSSGRCCPDGFSFCAGHCLQLLDQLSPPIIRNFTEAEESCAALGAHLATPRSKEENQCVADIASMTQFGSVFLGYRKGSTDGVFAGEDGCGPVGYDNWQSGGQPQDVSCGQVLSSGNWHGIPCSSSLYGPCEIGGEC